MKRKILLSIGALSTIIIPAGAVLSCGSSSDNSSKKDTSKPTIDYNQVKIDEQDLAYLYVASSYLKRIKIPTKNKLASKDLDISTTDFLKRIFNTAKDEADKWGSYHLKDITFDKLKATTNDRATTLSLSFTMHKGTQKLDFTYDINSYLSASEVQEYEDLKFLKSLGYDYRGGYYNDINLNGFLQVKPQWLNNLYADFWKGKTHGMNYLYYEFEKLKKDNNTTNDDYLNILRISLENAKIEWPSDKFDQIKILSMKYFGSYSASDHIPGVGGPTNGNAVGFLLKIQYGNAIIDKAFLFARGFKYT